MFNANVDWLKDGFTLCKLIKYYVRIQTRKRICFWLRIISVPMKSIINAHKSCYAVFIKINV